ncbi:MAG: hypothetical protein MH204_09805, partial [Fimbriimonadaceae bacterium]|nr:hypothetical protein [Fimbriimonadaceae bacterium]
MASRFLILACVLTGSAIASAAPTAFRLEAEGGPIVVRSSPGQEMPSEVWIDLAESRLTAEPQPWGSDESDGWSARFMIPEWTGEEARVLQVHAGDLL